MKLKAGGANGIDPESPQFKAAQKACQSIAPGGKGGPGRPGRGPKGGPGGSGGESGVSRGRGPVSGGVVREAGDTFPKPSMSYKHHR